MSVRVVFLGTSGSIPTTRRGMPSLVVQREGELLMFDCGEGTQRQMIKAGLGFGRPMKIFISHMHSDHILGLPGLLQTMSMMDRVKPLQIYGPQTLKDFLERVIEIVVGELNYPLEVYSVLEGEVCRGLDYSVQAVETDHTVQNFSYSIVEDPRPGRFYREKALSLGIPEGPLWKKLQRGQSITLDDGRVIAPESVLGPPRRGLKIVYSGDTRPSMKLVKLAANADLLIHEATFDGEFKDKARVEGHSTVVDAAEIAKLANVSKLVVTHISARYSETTLLLEQARKIFDNTVIAEDFMEIVIQRPK
ncbi:ribonuclease Z [Candidatus Bathyarchaeota archaeon]|nr:ribonuclease Z [Candidatus Bathyarchaeota archaeon]MBS7618722.1 ribonuclease Z [Candidatus Bathyarchaeota archaeon]